MSDETQGPADRPGAGAPGEGLPGGAPDEGLPDAGAPDGGLPDEAGRLGAAPPVAPAAQAPWSRRLLRHLVVDLGPVRRHRDFRLLWFARAVSLSAP